MHSAPAPGTRVAGRFLLESFVAAGGMGTVYRAQDEATGQPVAIKLLSSHGRPHGAARFAREARILAELHHPGIVRYLAHGLTEAGHPYLAMEWLDGEDLFQRLKRGALPLAESLSLVRRVAEALAVAHAYGVVHRDLKPSNLFLRGKAVEGVSILDFGVALGAEVSQALTRTGAVVGTPAYMAPEQARAAMEVGAAADVFSLGCVLFECLTGQPPFAASHVMAVLGKILFEEPPKLRALMPEAPASVEALLSLMLAKDVKRRPADARALLAALTSLEDLDLSVASSVGGSALRAQLTDDEQHLVSVLMAAPPPSEAPRSLEETIADAPFVDLRRELADLGARLEVLADGSLVATLGRGRGAATDQAAQAARCALALKARFPQATVAVSTGRGLLKERLLVGEVLDRAASLLRDRSASEATSSPILLDEVTRGLLDLRYAIERTESGGYALRGEELALDASRPLLGKPTPCVGRDVELGLLESVLTACIEESEPRAALVTAPPGTGKSRLMHELLRRVSARAEEVLVLIGRGDPLSAGSSYGLLGKALRRLCGIQGGESLASRRDKLTRRVGERLPAEERARVAAFVGEIAGVSFPDEDDARLRAARQDPQIMSDQMTRAALDLLRAEGNARPLLLLLEDLHWGDALTVKLCEVALRELKGVPILVLGLARPEVNDLFPRLWAGAAQTVPLRPLSAKAGARLVEHVLGKQLPRETVARIVEQSEGNALFLEELIRAVAEGRGDEAPETVLAMLQGRIGRLPVGARRVLRAASVFGERAWVDGLRALLGESLSIRDVEGELAALFQEEILEERRESRTQEEREVRFRHALMRDAAYGLLTDEDRAAAHRLAGGYLEARGEPDARVLAEHFVQGRAIERALPCFLRAADQSYEANDMEATIASAERALAYGATGEVRGALLGVLVAVYLGYERFSETLALGVEALASLEEGSRRWCRAFEHLFLAAAVSEQGAQFTELASRFTHVEPSADARGDYVRSASVLSIMLLLRGDKPRSYAFLRRAREAGATLDRIDQGVWAGHYMAEAMSLYMAEAAPWSCVLRYAESSALFFAAGLSRYTATIGAFHGRALYELGDRAGAERLLRESLARGEQSRESFALGYAKAFLATFLAMFAPLDELEEPARFASDVIIAENRTLIGAAYGALAEIKRRRGDLTGAEEDARSACEAARAFPPWSWDLIALRVEILCALGRTGEALACGEEGVERLERLGLTGYGELPLRLALIEAQRAAGRVTDARGQAEKAVTGLRLRLADIPEEAARERYLTCVPTNARIVAIAEELLGLEVSG